MKIIPTMDIQNGLVVQVRRSGPQKYYPLESVLVSNADPLSVFQAFHEKLGARAFYITDLNARHRIGDNFEIIKEMSKVEGVSLLVEAGVNTIESAQSLLQIGSTKAVIGTKHLDSMEEAIRILDTIGVDNVIFTVEMEQYETYADSVEIRRLKPIELVHHLWDFGLREFILLELSTIGTTQGAQVALLHFLREVIEQCKGAKIITGGGIRDIRDLVALRDIGVSGVMLGTALHKGTITVEEIKQL